MSTALWLEYHPVREADPAFTAGSLTVDTASFAAAPSGTAGGRLWSEEARKAMLHHAAQELRLGYEKMLGIRLADGGADAARAESGRGIRICHFPGAMKAGGYLLSGAKDGIVIEAADEAGALYGAFALLRRIAAGQGLPAEGERCEPDDPLRMLNHWDNLDGSIERGYSGRSFFFKDAQILLDERTETYARLCASVGLNAVVINNVNVKDDATWLITDRYFDRLRALSDLFAGYGITLYMSLNFAAPMELGGPASADPFDKAVIAWWRAKMAEVFTALPSLGGFLVKADSEGRPGPFTYGRTQADGANMLAECVAPYGGLIIWRCFVYNCQQDWRDRRTDRARSGYDAFITTDGAYRENVILQIKNGPMDFQIREPVHPLLGAMPHTSQMLEVQIAQEYTGHQIDVCYLIPMFREVLSFRTGLTGEMENPANGAAAGSAAGNTAAGGSAQNSSGKESGSAQKTEAAAAGSGARCEAEESAAMRAADSIASAAAGRTWGRPYGGIAAVANTGDDANWTGNALAAANWYGFGRLAFSNGLGAEAIAREWAALTFGPEADVIETVTQILMGSRETYEKYTSPLGIGWMVTPQDHYGPSIDGYEYSRWGTYHRADHLGIGVDRSREGTGYAQQYGPAHAAAYDTIETCPEELLLFFHHVPYTHRLSSGKTLIQHIYDTHFEGEAEAGAMAQRWESLRGRVPEDTFENVRERFERQLFNAREWRDQVNSYFFRKSGIPDEQGRMIY